MFDFVIMMKDVIENLQEVFGMFATMPEKVMNLPGTSTVPVFDKFLQTV